MTFKIKRRSKREMIAMMGNKMMDKKIMKSNRMSPLKMFSIVKRLLHIYPHKRVIGRAHSII